mgnify:CR=1 FL=1
MSNICAICDGSPCNVIVDVEHIKYKDTTLVIPNCKFYKCESCGSEFVDFVLHDENIKLIRQAKQEFDDKQN